MNLVEIFADCGIDSYIALEAMLLEVGDGRGAGGSVGRYHPEVSYGHDFSLAAKLCTYFRRAQQSVETVTARPGIQQLSLSRSLRVPGEDVRKALLLSRTSTVLTDHEMKWDSYTVFSSDDAPTATGGSWQISPDFIRDAYMYADLIDNSDLLLLPNRVSISDTPYRDDGLTNPTSTTESRDLQLLRELDATRVINLPIPSSLLDAIIGRYWRNRQLVVLPEIQLSYIDRISLADLVQIRADSRDELEDFQRAYHAALLEQLANSADLDFSRISAQIQRDILEPPVRRIEKRHQRILSSHRSLTRVGATASLLPLGSVVVSAALFGELLTAPVFAALLGAFGGLAGTLYANRTQRRRAIEALDDDIYFVLWRLGEPR